MNLFLDTAVLLGYAFETDHWNGKSLNVISHTSKKYSSTNVEIEFDTKSQTKIRTIKGMFYRFKREVRLSKSKEEIESYIKYEDFEIKDIILEIMLNCGSSDVKDIIKYVDSYQISFEKKCKLNSENLKKLLQFHNRTAPYRDVYDLCVLDGFVKDDPADVEIIIDAHDLGQKISPLFFVTGDYRDIVSRKQFIENNTSIEEVIYLKHFNFA